ncbi:MAG: nucleoside-diphosphate kinase [Verrucomicrobiota bacterium]
MQKTLILLKPDCLKKGHVGEVIGRFEKAGFKIVACKMIQLNSTILKNHYAHVADKPFYPEIEKFMSSLPVIAMVIKGTGVIAKVRDMVGPTDSKKAPKGTIRGDLGKDMMVNIIHASDSTPSAKTEIARFFKDKELY